MRNFDFKKILKEEIYNFKYPHQDKIRIVLSEGQTLLIEKEIHEGIMDRMAGYSKEQPGWEKEMSNIIDQWLAQSDLSDEGKAKAKARYTKHFEQLPAGEWDDPNPKAEKDIEDSLEAISKGDIKTASDKLKSAEEEWTDEEPSGDDREAKLAAKEKEWDEKGLNKNTGEPIMTHTEAGWELSKFDRPKAKKSGERAERKAREAAERKARKAAERQKEFKSMFPSRTFWEEPKAKKSGERRSIFGSEEKLINDLATDLRNPGTHQSLKDTGPDLDGATDIRLDTLLALQAHLVDNNLRSSEWPDGVTRDDAYKLFNFIKKVVANKSIKKIHQDLKESKNQQKILESIIIKCIEVYIKNENKKQLKS